MRLVTLDSKMLKLYTADKEMLQKSRRPSVLLVKLAYKGHKYDFAVPLRSNISPSAPKDQYFPLPPREKTRDGYRHGVHYIKMFPVEKSFVHKFRTDGNKYYETIKSILDKNEKQIVLRCQNYLKDYENGIRPNYATDIDLLINLMHQSCNPNTK